MKLIFIITLFYSYTLVCSDSLPPISHYNWEELESGEIWVGWTYYNDTQWCRARTIINVPLKNISTIIENKVNYPNIFKRVESATMITDEVVHIILDMPFPFYGRDYIVNYKQLFEKNGDLIYQYQAVKNSGIPLNTDYVRLINAAGEWRLHSITEKSTEVIYSWNGELLGDFPNWALTEAWKTQGIEVLTWLKDALKE